MRITKLCLLIILCCATTVFSQTSPNVTQIQTFSNISALKNARHTTTGTYAVVNGYYQSGDGGGGTFFWNAATPKSSHNGGTIIDPTHAGVVGSSDWYVPVATSTSGCWERPKNAEGFNVLEWGAIGDAEVGMNPLFPDLFVPGDTATGTDSFFAIQAIVNHIESLQGDYLFGPGDSTIVFPNKNFYIGQTIQCRGNLWIKGQHNPKHIYRGPNAYITGAPGMGSIFRLLGSESATPGMLGTSYGFKITNIGAVGYVGGPSVFIESVAQGAPARPFVVEGVQAKGFSDTVFLFNDQTLASTTLVTGVSNISIMGCVFSGNTYTIRTIGVAAVGQITFVNNVSEQGGRLLFGDAPGGIFSTYNITDNVFEGQSNAININSAESIGFIGRNYFEQNTGDYLIRVKTAKGSLVSPNTNSYLEIGTNYINNCPSVATYYDVTAGNVKLSNTGWRGPVNPVRLGSGHIKIDQAMTYYTSNSTQTCLVFDMDSAFKQMELAELGGAIASYVTVIASAAAAPTYITFIGSLSSPLGDDDYLMLPAWVATRTPQVRFATITVDVTENKRLICNFLVHTTEYGRLAPTLTNAVTGARLDTSASGSENDWIGLHPGWNAVSYVTKRFTAGEAASSFRFGVESYSINAPVYISPVTAYSLENTIKYFVKNSH